jgi:hypothetical protein
MGQDKSPPREIVQPEPRTCETCQTRSDKKFENIYDLGKFILTWWHTNVKTINNPGPLEPHLELLQATETTKMPPLSTQEQLM